MNMIDMEPTIKSSFPVSGMSCAGCATSIQAALNDQPGVQSAQVNFANSTALVEYAPGIVRPESLKSAVNGIGYDLFVEANKTEAAEKLERAKTDELKTLKEHTVGAAFFTAPLMVIGMFLMNMPFANWIMLGLSAPVILHYGRRFYLSAVRQLRHRTANMDTLVAVSTGIAFLFSLFNTVYPEYWTSRGLAAHVYYEAAAAIIAFVLLGKYLEERAKTNASSAIKNLMGLRPSVVTRVDSDGAETSVPIGEVVAGDMLVVKPGEKIAVDGIVSEGESYVDASMMSGEPLPVRIAAGKQVYAGTINQKGSFRFVAKKVGEETMLGQIIKTVQEAQGSKAPVQKLVDRIAGIFVPVVLGISIVTFLTWLFFGGDQAFSHGLLTAITVLVIACPCALGLATPTAIMVGVGKGAEHNILIKDAESLERAHTVDTIVLDKTGTITAGEPVVTDFIWADGGADTGKLREILFALERKSEHPLAGAVLNRLEAEQSIGQTPLVLGFQAIPGNGVSGVVSGTNYVIGNRRLLADRGVELPANLLDRIGGLEQEAKTVVFFASENRLLAVLGIADPIKPTSRAAIRATLARGIDVHLLTGDNATTAEAVARSVGLDGKFQADQLPADKARFVKRLQAEGRVVAMVGDGINDSQALAEADISIAMGQGADIAMDVAKMTLISSDLNSIPRALELSRRTMRTLKQNLFWAFIYNLIGIPLAAGVLYSFNGFLLNPMIAAGAMAFSSVSVVLNSLRLKGQVL